MYRSHIVYKIVRPGELLRYTVLERLSERGFYVLHADFLRPGDQSNAVYLANLTTERLLDIEPDTLPWRESLEAAVQSHDEDFGN